MPAGVEGEGLALTRLVHDFLWDWAPSNLTSSEHTLRGYRTTITLYLRWLAGRGVTPESLSASDFCAAAIEGWLAWLADERGNSPQTCNVRLAHLRTFARYASSRDATFCHLAPEAASVRTRRARKTKVEGMGEEAVRALLASPDQSTRTGRRDLALMVFLYSTACRVGEALGCRLSQLRLDDAHPHATIVGKGNKARVLYLSERAAAHLRAYVLEFHGSDPDPERFLFWSRNQPEGRAPLSQDAVTKLLRKHAAAARRTCPAVPADITPHRLRHARATHWLDRGMRLAQVSLMLGHASVQTTMDYLDVSVEAKSDAMQSMAGAPGPKRWKSEGARSLLECCGLA